MCEVTGFTINADADFRPIFELFDDFQEDVAADEADEEAAAEEVAKEEAEAEEKEEAKEEEEEETLLLNARFVRAILFYLNFSIPCVRLIL